MDERRRAAWRALGLGPIWVAREDPGAVPPAAGTSPSVVAVAEPLPADPLGAPFAVAAPGNAPTPDAPASLFPDEALAPGAFFTVPDGADARLARLQALAGEVAGCPKCRLCESRTRTVFDSGHPGARWLVLGEAPGADEDATGEVFVGASGRLLTRMLAAIGLDRGTDVYLCNVVKCRPPKNRNPQADEVAACSGWLREQIALVRPDLILAMGAVAARAATGSRDAIGSLRGRLHRYEHDGLSVPVVVSWHPSYLLREPAAKAGAWADLCLAQATGPAPAR